MKATFRVFLLGLFVFVGYAANSLVLAQTSDSTGKRPVIRPAPTDTLPPAEAAADDMAELVDSLAPAVDTVRVSAAAQAAIDKIIPKKATIRSALLPGWGQVYNRQYWKVPLVVAGFTTFGIILTRFTANYNKYYNAYYAAYPKDPTTGTPVALTGNQGQTITVPVDDRLLSLSQLQQLASFWRRWRDYNIIFTALFWGLNVVDANVSAHLKTFDVSDSLTLRYAPSVIPTPMGYVPGLRLTMTFRK